MTGTITRQEDESVRDRIPSNPAAGGSRLREARMHSTPAVDLGESQDGFWLVADMPGVEPKSLEVTVERNVLTLEGQVRVDVPDGFELAGREYWPKQYRRVFVLPDIVQVEGIKARIHHGVVVVSLPKRRAVQPRKIMIDG